MKVIVIQLTLILISLIIALSIYRITKAFVREKRIANFAISNDDLEELSFSERLSKFYWKVIRSLSKHLGSNKIIEALSRDYDRYILTSEKKYKSSIDYMTVKIISTMLFIILIVLLIILNALPNNIFLLVIFMIIGFFFPDIIWMIQYLSRCSMMSSKLNQSIIIISDNIDKMNIENAIGEVVKRIDGPIKDEYKKMLVDLSYNISLRDAYYRFYKRTKIKDIMDICNILDIGEYNLYESFKIIREKYDFMIKKNNITSNINSILTILSYVYILIPVLFVIIITIAMPNYFNIFKMYAHGYVIMVILVLLYLILLYSIKKITGVKR